MRLRAKLALSLTAVLAVLVLAAAWLSWTGVREEIRTGVSNQLFSLVSYAAGGMDNDLRIAVETTEAVARGVPASALASAEALSRHMSRLPMPMGAIERCVAVAPDGRALAQQPALPPLENRQFSEREYFRRAIETREPVISRPFRGAISGAPVIIVAVPRLAAGKVELVMQCSLYLLNDRLFGEIRTARFGKTGYLYVASRDRKLVLHPDKSRILADSPPVGANPAADKAGEGFEGTVESVNSAGLRALMSFKQLKATDWFVAGVYPLAEADLPLREARDRVIAITLSALLACAVCAWLLAGLLVRPVERLTRYVGILRERPEAAAHRLPLRNDEIGELAQAFNGLLSELREREMRLRNSEEKFAKAFNANPSYATVSRLEDGKFVAVNRGFERMTGWTAQEVLGRTALDIGLWADPVEREELVRHLKKEGEWLGFKVHFNKKNGETILVEGSCVLAEIGGEQQIIGVARDITEVQRAEDARRQSEEKFATVFHASPDGIMVVRAEDGLVMDLNESYQGMLGYSREEAVGRTVLELGLWARPEMRDRFLAEVRARGKVSSYEFAARTRDGTLRDMMTSTALIDIGGTPCLISVVSDVTDQRSAEEEIHNLNVALENRVRERTAELEEAVHEMESFSYSISHDLRAPLRAIAGYAKIIEEDYATHIDAEGKRLLDRIAGGAIRMGELIDDLLDFSRIGRAELKKVPIEMTGLVREVLGDMPEGGSGHHLQMRIGALPAAVADRGLLRQVWANLLSNAIKYSRQRDPMIIEVGGATEGGALHYWVRDNGAGFDMAYAGKLFQVFQRLHREPAFEGTGVGLAIVARIVQRHGGRVWAEGEPDKGATFHFTLPQA